MESIDHIRERFERLEQQTEPWKQQTRMGEQRRRGWRLTWCAATIAVLGFALVRSPVVQAEIFPCSGGDVPCLIDAINTANANGTENTIRLEAGTYTLTASDNDFNGLPVITSTLTIMGEGAETTIIERAINASAFRLLDVAPSGVVVLEHLTLQGGAIVGVIFNTGTLTLRQSVLTGNSGLFLFSALFNTGIVTIERSTLSNNRGDDAGALYNAAGGRVDITDSVLRIGGAVHGPGGIFNEPTGVVVIIRSTLEHNGGNGPSVIDNGGTILIRQSAVIANVSSFNGFGDTIFNSGLLEITNTTIARNVVGNLADSSAITNWDTVIVTNSTIADNVYDVRGRPQEGSAAILSILSATTVLQNTILARNVVRDLDGNVVESLDCIGPVISLGNNLIGTTKGCTITLQLTDLTGDPGLDTFTDDGTPGNAHFPLLPTSQAIDAGNDAACPRIDQLGQRRIGPCDIGAIRFLDNSDLEPKDDLATAAQVSR